MKFTPLLLIVFIFLVSCGKLGTLTPSTPDTIPYPSSYPKE